MSILIAGAGATGGYLGAHLARAGRDVRFLVRPGRAAQLARDGLVLRTAEGTESLPVTAFTASGLPPGPADVILITVKGQTLPEIIPELAPAAGPETALIPVLNGTRHLAILNDAFGKDRVLGGSALLATQLNQAGEIVVLNQGADLLIGAQGPDATSLAQKAAGLLTGVGFSVRLSERIIDEMWSKWAFIATAGAVTCLLGGTVGEIVAAGGTPTAQAVVAEVAAVVSAAGHPVDEQTRASLISAFTTPGSPFAPSMYRDLEQGRPVEADQVLGDLADHGRARHLATPLLDAATVRLRAHNARLDPSQ